MKEISIGNQIWTSENLDSETLNSGKQLLYIPYSFDEKGNISDDCKKEWIDAVDKKIPAYCYPLNKNREEDKLNGLIYNIWAIKSKDNVIPEGYKVPNNSDWQKLIKSLGVKPQKMIRDNLSGNLRPTTKDDWGIWDIIRAEDIGFKFKVSEGWDNDNGGNNELGFNAVPLTNRIYNGDIQGWPSATFWGSSKDKAGDTLFVFTLTQDNHHFDVIYRNEFHGYPIRCIKI